MLLTRMRLFVIMIRVGNADYGGRLKNLVNPKANARDYLTWCCWVQVKRRTERMPDEMLTLNTKS